MAYCFFSVWGKTDFAQNARMWAIREKGKTMAWAEHKLGGLTIIKPGRFVAADELRAFRKRLDTLTEETAARVVVDFSTTEHVHYRLADLLSYGTHAMARSDGRLVLAGLNPSLVLMFALLTRYDALDVVEHIEDALGSFIPYGQA